MFLSLLRFTHKSLSLEIAINRRMGHPIPNLTQCRVKYIYMTYLLCRTVFVNGSSLYFVIIEIFCGQISHHFSHLIRSLD